MTAAGADGIGRAERDGTPDWAHAVRELLHRQRTGGGAGSDSSSLCPTGGLFAQGHEEPAAATSRKQTEGLIVTAYGNI